MPLYLVGTRKELRENAEKRESDLKNKENDEKQEEKRNKHAAEVKARAARAMEKHVTTSPPKSAASEQGCRCDAVDDIETPAGFCLNTQNSQSGSQHRQHQYHRKQQEAVNVPESPMCQRHYKQ